MHSFLSKVFGRKKEDKATSPTTLAPGELLDGKFEAVSPTVSPSANNFLELDSNTNGHDAKNTDKDVGFSRVFRAKSRPSSPEVNHKKLDTLPHLSLNFRETREEVARELGFLLDVDSGTHDLLSEAIIGQRRLNPLEALILIQACSKAITTRGLETLGIMHPHWYSSSADIQRRLISHFLQSLDFQESQDAGSPVSLTSPASLFESELNFTRSPHDIAAVLRWGLRHLQIEGDSFGTDDRWYKSFLDAEAAAEYPPKAFSEKLAPTIPPAHLDLLTATLEIFSSLAAHAEANSTSGSKLCKMFGLWLLTARRIEDKDDWVTFYARWERTGRMLEHLFLARIRDESTDQRMPVRLLELVRKYPYTQGLSSPGTDLRLLPPPRFTTLRYEALFVRIEVEFPKASLKPKSRMHPLNLLADAFSTQVTEGEFAGLWAKITAASKNGSNPSALSDIFSDETIRFLSIVPDGRAAKTQAAKSPTFSLLPVSPVKKSASDGAQDQPIASTSQHRQVASEPPLTTPVSPLAIGSDWVQFSSSGFLDSTPAIGPLVSTLFDTDIEKTVPPAPVSLSRKSSRRLRSPRKSIDVPRISVAEDGVKDPELTVQDIKPVVKASKLEIIEFDEAFIDFWSDSLLDPITAAWPTFIICKFKSTLVPSLLYGPIVEGQAQKTLKWLVLEQAYTVRPPSPPPSPPVAAAVAVSSSPPPETVRPVSPSPSTKKRFNFFSRSISGSSLGSLKGKKKEKAVIVGEMGELVEEDHQNHGVKAEVSAAERGSKFVEQDQGKDENIATDEDHTQAAVVAAVVATAAGTAGAATVVSEEDAAKQSAGKDEEAMAPADETGTAAAPVEEVATSNELVAEEEVPVVSAAEPTAEAAPAAEDVAAEPVVEEEVLVVSAAEPATEVVPVEEGVTAKTESVAEADTLSPEVGVTVEEEIPAPATDTAPEVVESVHDEVNAEKPVVEDETVATLPTEAEIVAQDQDIPPKANNTVLEEPATVLAASAAVALVAPVAEEQPAEEPIIESSEATAVQDVAADTVAPVEEEISKAIVEEPVPAFEAETAVETPLVQEEATPQERAVVESEVVAHPASEIDVASAPVAQDIAAPVEEEVVADVQVAEETTGAPEPESIAEPTGVEEESASKDIVIEEVAQTPASEVVEDPVVAPVSEATPVEEAIPEGKGSVEKTAEEANGGPEAGLVAETVPVDEEPISKQPIAEEAIAAAAITGVAALAIESADKDEAKVNDVPALDAEPAAEAVLVEPETETTPPDNVAVEEEVVAHTTESAVAEENQVVPHDEAEEIEAPIAEAASPAVPVEREDEIETQDEAAEIAAPVAEPAILEKEGEVVPQDEVEEPAEQEDEVATQHETAVEEMAVTPVAEAAVSEEDPVEKGDKVLTQEEGEVAGPDVEKVDEIAPQVEEEIEAPVAEAAAEVSAVVKENEIAPEKQSAVEEEVTAPIVEAAVVEKVDEIATQEEEVEAPGAETAAEVVHLEQEDKIAPQGEEVAAPVEEAAIVEKVDESAPQVEEIEAPVAETATEVVTLEEDGEIAHQTEEDAVGAPVTEAAAAMSLLATDDEIAPQENEQVAASVAEAAFVKADESGPQNENGDLEQPITEAAVEVVPVQEDSEFVPQAEEQTEARVPEAADEVIPVEEQEEEPQVENGKVVVSVTESVEEFSPQVEAEDAQVPITKAVVEVAPVEKEDETSLHDDEQIEAPVSEVVAEASLVTTENEVDTEDQVMVENEIVTPTTKASAEPPTVEEETALPVTDAAAEVAHDLDDAEVVEPESAIKTETEDEHTIAVLTAEAEPVAGLSGEAIPVDDVATPLGDVEPIAQAASAESAPGPETETVVEEIASADVSSDKPDADPQSLSLEPSIEAASAEIPSVVPTEIDTAENDYVDPAIPIPVDTEKADNEAHISTEPALNDPVVGEESIDAPTELALTQEDLPADSGEPVAVEETVDDIPLAPTSIQEELAPTADEHVAEPALVADAETQQELSATADDHNNDVSEPTLSQRADATPVQEVHLSALEASEEAVVIEKAAVDFTDSTPFREEVAPLDIEEPPVHEADVAADQAVDVASAEPDVISAVPQELDSVGADVVEEHSISPAPVQEEDNSPAIPEQPDLNENIADNSVSLTTEEPLISQETITAEHPVEPAPQEMDAFVEEPPVEEEIPAVTQEPVAADTEEESAPRIAEESLTSEAIIADQAAEPLPQETNVVVEEPYIEVAPVEEELITVEPVAADTKEESTLPIADESSAEPSIQEPDSVVEERSVELVPVEVIREPVADNIEEEPAPPTTDNPLVSEPTIIADRGAEPSPQDPISLVDEVVEEPSIELAHINEELHPGAIQEPIPASANAEEAVLPTTEETLVSETDIVPENFAEPAQEPIPIVEEVVEEPSTELAPVTEEVNPTALQEPVSASEDAGKLPVPRAADELIVSEATITADHATESVSHEPESAVEVVDEPSIENAPVEEELEPASIQDLVVADIEEPAPPTADEPVVSDHDVTITADCGEEPSASQAQEPTHVVEEAVEDPSIELAPVTEELAPAAVPEPDIVDIKESKPPAADEPLVSGPATNTDHTAEPVHQEPISLVKEVVEEPSIELATVEEEPSPPSTQEPISVNEKNIEETVSPTAEENLVPETDIAAEHASESAPQEPIPTVEEAITVSEEPPASEISTSSDPAVETAPQEPNSVVDEPSIELAPVTEEIHAVVIQEPAVADVEEKSAPPTAEEPLVSEPVSDVDHATEPVPEEPIHIVEEAVDEASVQLTPVAGINPTASEEPAAAGVGEESTPPAADEPLVSEATIAADHAADLASQEPEPVAEVLDESSTENVANKEEPKPAAIQEAVAVDVEEEFAPPTAEETLVSETDAVSEHLAEPAQEPTPIVEEVAEEPPIDLAPIQEPVAADIEEEPTAPTAEEPIASEATVTADHAAESASQEPEPVADVVDEPFVENAPVEEELNPAANEEPVADIEGEQEEPAPPTADEPFVSEATTTADHVEPAHQESNPPVETVEEPSAELAPVEEEPSPPSTQEPISVSENIEEVVEPITEETLVSETDVAEENVVEPSPQEPIPVVKEKVEEPSSEHPPGSEEISASQGSQKELEPPTAEELLVDNAADLSVDAPPAEEDVVPAALQKPTAVSEEVIEEQSVEPSPTQEEPNPAAIQEPTPVSEELVEDAPVAPAEEEPVLPPAKEEQIPNADDAAEKAPAEPVIVEDNTATANFAEETAMESEHVEVEEPTTSDAAISTHISSEVPASPVEVSVPDESSAVEKLLIEPESATVESVESIIPEAPLIEPVPVTEGSEEPSTTPEEISQSSEVLKEDPVVVAAESEAANGSGNGHWHHGATDMQRLEIPDIMHRSVSETMNSSVLSPWSDDNTQLASPLSPTTLVEAGVHADLSSKIETLLAATNGHEHKSLDEVLLPSKELESDPIDAAPILEATAGDNDLSDII